MRWVSGLRNSYLRTQFAIQSWYYPRCADGYPRRLKELILDGKSVRLSDLGLFSVGMTSRGEVSKEKVTAASVLGIHLIVRNTKSWSNSELKKLTRIAAYDEYSAVGDAGGTDNPSGGSGTGDTTQGGDSNPSGGGSNPSGGDSNPSGGGTTDGDGTTGEGGVEL